MFVNWSWDEMWCWFFGILVCIDEIFDDVLVNDVGDVIGDCVEGVCEEFF